MMSDTLIQETVFMQAHGETHWRDRPNYLDLREFVENYLATLPVRSEISEHSDDKHVNRFSAAMKRKLALKREQGRGGWDDPKECSIDYLAQLLFDHLNKGDPVDIANFCMMIQERGSTSAIHEAYVKHFTQPVRESGEQAKAKDFVNMIRMKLERRFQVADYMPDSYAEPHNCRALVSDMCQEFMAHVREIHALAERALSSIQEGS